MPTQEAETTEKLESVLLQDGDPSQQTIDHLIQEILAGGLTLTEENEDNKTLADSLIEPQISYLEQYGGARCRKLLKNPLVHDTSKPSRYADTATLASAFLLDLISPDEQDEDSERILIQEIYNVLIYSLIDAATSDPYNQTTAPILEKLQALTKAQQINDFRLTLVYLQRLYPVLPRTTTEDTRPSLIELLARRITNETGLSIDIPQAENWSVGELDFPDEQEGSSASTPPPASQPSPTPQPMRGGRRTGVPDWLINPPPNLPDPFPESYQTPPPLPTPSPTPTPPPLPEPVTIIESQAPTAEAEPTEPEPIIAENIGTVINHQAQGIENLDAEALATDIIFVIQAIENYLAEHQEENPIETGLEALNTNRANPRFGETLPLLESTNISHALSALLLQATNLKLRPDEDKVQPAILRLAQNLNLQLDLQRADLSRRVVFINENVNLTGSNLNFAVLRSFDKSATYQFQLADTEMFSTGGGFSPTSATGGVFVSGSDPDRDAMQGHPEETYPNTYFSYLDLPLEPPWSTPREYAEIQEQPGLHQVTPKDGQPIYIATAHLAGNPAKPAAKVIFRRRNAGTNELEVLAILRPVLDGDGNQTRTDGKPQYEFSPHYTAGTMEVLTTDYGISAEQLEPPTEKIQEKPAPDMKTGWDKV